MSAKNPKLTAANESAVLALVQNSTARQQWGAFKYLNGIKQANWAISKLFGVPVSTVDAARFYWN